MSARRIKVYRYRPQPTLPADGPPFAIVDDVVQHLTDPASDLAPRAPDEMIPPPRRPWVEVMLPELESQVPGATLEPRSWSSVAWRPGAERICRVQIEQDDVWGWRMWEPHHGQWYLATTSPTHWLMLKPEYEARVLAEVAAGRVHHEQVADAPRRRVSAVSPEAATTARPEPERAATGRTGGREARA